MWEAKDPALKEALRASVADFAASVFTAPFTVRQIREVYPRDAEMSPLLGILADEALHQEGPGARYLVSHRS